jgi:hypothetical protein
VTLLLTSFKESRPNAVHARITIIFVSDPTQTAHFIPPQNAYLFMEVFICHPLEEITEISVVLGTSLYDKKLRFGGDFVLTNRFSGQK